MTAVDHVTVHVPAGTLERNDLIPFFRQIGMYEVRADDVFEHGWRVRWFAPFEDGDIPARKPFIHLVEGINQVLPIPGVQPDRDYVSLGHFCVAVPRSLFETAARSEWCVRNSGSGRIWLRLANVRVEVRSL